MKKELVRKKAKDAEAENREIEELIVRYLKSGTNIFLTGAAGVGKTYLANRIKTHFDNVILLGSTGVSALRIGGDTLHSFFKFFVSKDIEQLQLSDEKHIDMIAEKRRVTKAAANEIFLKNIKECLRVADLIIIDEISMVSKELMEMIDYRLRLSAKDIPILAVGDFFQLPPVKSEGFAFESPYWNFKAIELTKVKRTDDTEFTEILSLVRIGDNSERVTRYLKSLEERQNKSIPVRLFSTNVEVEKYNRARLNELKGETFEAKATATILEEGFENEVGEFMKSQNIPEIASFKTGARVMFTVNNKDEGYVNGELGTIIGFDELEDGTDVIIVKKDDGKIITVSPFQFHKDKIFADEDKLKLKTVFEVDAYPLRLAYASTVHKVQGLSIPSLYIDCKRFFLPSQLYVALSRSSNPDDLTMVNFSPDKIIANPKVVQWYNQIQDKIN